jgi:hypothetical protein
MILFDVTWSEFFAVFIASALKPGIAGIPSAVLVFGFNFFETFIICSLGGITGSFIFSYLIDAVLKLFNSLLLKFFPERNKNKKKFTKVNRFIIATKKKFGIIGVSIISPLFLSIPLGVFLCLKFFGDRKKIFLWMSIFVMFWTTVLYFGLLHFRNVLEKFFL